MRRRMIALALALPLLAATSAQAQNPWSFELGGGSAFATQDLGGADLGLGLGFEATVGYRFLPHLAAYAGWDWVHFAIDEDVAADDVEETGYAFGLRFEHPLPAPWPMVRVRAGGTYDHVEIEDDDGELVADSDHTLGWDAGLGVIIPIGTTWEITPGARYRALSADIEAGDVTNTVDLTYVMVELGFRKIF